MAILIASYNLALYMTSRSENNIQRFDTPIISIFLALMIVGWLSIYASEYTPDKPTSILDYSTSSGRQFIFLIASMLVSSSMLFFNNKFYRTFSVGFYGLSIFLLLLVLVLGQSVHGDAAWINLGLFKLQPSEFAKPATALFLASFMDDAKLDLSKFINQAKVFAIIAIPMFLILLQGDVGSMLVFLSFLIVFYRAGAPSIYYVIGIITILLSILALIYPVLSVISMAMMMAALFCAFNLDNNFIWYIVLSFSSILIMVLNYLGHELLSIGISTPLLIGLLIVLRKRKLQLAAALTIAVIGAIIYVFSVSYIFYKVLEPHQQCRVMVWLKPDSKSANCDDHNIKESKRAIASGGALGKGFLEGEGAQMDRVPEQSTDFIFCTIGEEHGFIGTLAVIFFYGLLLYRILHIAERQRSDFNRYYAYGAAGIIFTHVFINIGMTVGLMPIIGIPLPFLSHGGSSLIGFTILLTILIRLDHDRIISRS